MKTPESASPVITAPVYFPGREPTNPNILVWRTDIATPINVTHVTARIYPTFSSNRADVSGIMTKRIARRIRLEETLKFMEQKALK